MIQGFFKAGVAALAAATLANVASANEIARRTPAPVSFNCAKEWKDDNLFDGKCPALGSGLDVGLEVDLDIALPVAAINGDISIGLTEDFSLNPTLSIDLSGLEVYVEVDVSASAAIYQTIELLSSAQLALQVPGLLEVGVQAGLALDLVIGVSAAIDLETGFHLTFPEDSIVEISLLTQELVSGSLTGVVARALDLALGLDVDLSVEVELDLGLRLRALVAVEAGLDIVGLDIGAGLEAAIFISLFDCTRVIIATSACPLSIEETIALELGIAVSLDIKVDDVLEISLAPSLFIELAAAESISLCLATIPPCSRCSGGYTPGNPGSSGSPGLPSVSGGLVTITTPALPGHTSIPSGYVPTTIIETNTHTITRCAAAVKNCPADYTQQVVYSTTDVTVTYCPATQSGPVATPSAPASVQVPTPTGAPISFTQPPATTKTYTVPADVPTPVHTVPAGTVPAETAPTHTGPAVQTHSVPPSQCVGCVGAQTGVSVSYAHLTTSAPVSGPTTVASVRRITSTSSVAVTTPTMVPGSAARTSSGAVGFVAVFGVLAALF